MNALRAFEAAARCRSISDASEELFVTPSAVSQQIKKLEENLGMDLLRREHRKVSLTDEGRRLSISLTDAFFGLRQVIDDLTADNNTECLEIACPPPFAAKFLAPRLSQFITDHPDLNVRLVVGLEKVDYLSSGINVGVRLSPNDQDGMVNSEPVWEYKAPLATERYLRELQVETPGDLCRATLLEKDFGELMPDAPTWKRWYDVTGQPVPEKQRFVDFGVHCDQALDAAAAHNGVVLGELITGSNMIFDDNLVCPFGPILPVGLGYRVVRDERAPQSEAVALFTTWIEGELQDAAEKAEALRIQHGAVVERPLRAVG
jgi:LysR family glycine cleavage system transcriptional activator